MKLAITSFTAALSLTASLPAQTAGFDGFIDSLDGRNFDIFVDSPDWKFFRTPAYCYATEDNERGTLLIGYDQRRNQVHLAFWNTAITRYSTADTTNLEMAFAHITPGAGVGPVNREWGLNKYVVAINASGQRVFNTKLNGQQALRDLSRFDVVTFLTVDGRALQTFQLAQSAQALKRLAACRPR